MIVPQPTAQYGQVERVSVARAIFRVRNCAYAGWRSNPKTAAAAPPTAVYFRKSRREGFIGGPQSASRTRGAASRVNSFIELQPQTVKQTFDAEQLGGATRKRRCQPADADVVVRGDSVSVEVAAAR